LIATFGGWPTITKSIQMATEADTCPKFVVPKLQAAERMWTHAGNKMDRINKMNRITANQSGEKSNPVNPAHPVNGFALNEIAGKFCSAMPSINPSRRCLRLRSNPHR
jgi:hypothetical protein